MIEHAHLIAMIPVVASAIMLFGAREDPRSPAPWIGIGAMAIVLGMALSISAQVASGAVALPFEKNWTWFSFATSVDGKPFVYDMPVGVLIDGPAALLLVVVALVSLMVQIYSIAYMHDDKRTVRYFAFVSFFTAAMLGLVVSSNLLVGFMCWELMGLSSYLLIGFWFEKDAPCEAAKKAFMTTKLGDSGLYLALLFLFVKVGSFQLTQIQQFYVKGYMPAGAAAAVALGLLLGAMGKSAQAPLFVWLPDAMEGPTPVSALIHAATMVAAGIFLVARAYFVFLASPAVMDAAAWIGCATAFLAASMALVSYDIKRVLAFSTISQLGFMMCALGVGGYTAGLFHLATHAFFKALLFLAAGSVIHAVRTNDIRLMGGLSKKLPVTFVTMFLAACAISGVPGLSGAYSKDMILADIWHKNQVLFWISFFTACMTAFYMFRLIFLTFLGSERDCERHRHAHESPFLMTGPLVLLAFLSVVSGWLLNRNDFVYTLLAPPMSAELMRAHLPHGLHYVLIAAIAGSISLSYALYKGPAYATASAIKSRLAAASALLERRWFFDDVFDGLVAFCDRVAALAYAIDARVIDRVFVDGWGLLTRVCAEISNLIDALCVDKTVDGFGGLSLDLGVGLRALVKDGQVQEYLMYVAIAFSLAATLILSR